MKLELNIHEVKNVNLAVETNYSSNILSVDHNELRELLLNDKRFSSIEIELVHPGESCRILRVSDVIEPRAKIEGSEDFPGALSQSGSAGYGKTCVLKGVAVVLSDYTEEGRFGRDLDGELIDMSGLGGDLSPYSKTHNIVIVPYPAEGVSKNEYRAALKFAGLKAAVYLAKTAINCVPDTTEIFELPALTELAGSTSGLPKIAYIFQVLSTQHGVVPGEPVLYGQNIELIAPTILHPNEVIDGAITCPYRAFCGQTYTIQNHPIIKELYRRHGSEICFAGVIICTAHHNEPEFERTASIASNLAKWVIGADGVILTKTGGGAPEIPLGRTAQKCEELGVQTAIAMLHMSADPTYTKFDYSINFNLPRVNAIVSMGSPNMPFVLPPMERIIGRSALQDANSRDKQTILMWIKGACSQLGESRITLVPY